MVLEWEITSISERQDQQLMDIHATIYVEKKIP